MIPRSAVFVGAATGVCVISLTTYAYETATHEEVITRAAIERSALQVTPSALNDIGLQKTVSDQTQLFPDSRGALRTIQRLIEIGARFEDSTFPTFRFTRHFYNPVSGAGLHAPNIGAQTASPEWALAPQRTDSAQEFSYWDARQYLFDALTAQIPARRNRAFGLAFESLGRVAHHLQDMSQPQHVRNDVHCNFVPLCGPLNVHAPSLYEHWTDRREIRERISQRYANPAAIGYEVGSAQFAATYNSPRRLWHTQPPGESSPALGKGIAEFTNRNFVSAGTNFHWTGTTFTHDPRFSLPLPLGVFERRQITDPDLLGPDQPLRGEIHFIASEIKDNFTGQTVFNSRAATLSIFDADLQKSTSPLRSVTLNALNFEAAHQHLIPRAVAFSTGLIDYFFRGRLEVLDLPGVPNTRLVRNLGTETMKGTLAFYYDAADGQRFQVPGARWENITLPPAAPSNPLEGFQLSFHAPVSPQPKVPGEYMLVFNGDMGEEKSGPGMVGAVVGKWITVPYNGALYVAGEDSAGKTVYFKVDKNGVSSVAPAQAGPFRSVSKPGLRERAYHFKQAEITILPTGVTVHRTVGLALKGDFGDQSWVPLPGSNDLRVLAGMWWSAKSPDPSVGSFEFRLVHLDSAGRQANLSYTRRFTDAQGQQTQTSGNLRLPDLPADAGYTYPDFGRGMLILNGQGTEIYPRGNAHAERYGVRLTLAEIPSAALFDLPRETSTVTVQPDFTKLEQVGQCAIDYVHLDSGGPRPATVVGTHQREERLTTDTKRVTSSTHIVDFIRGTLLSYTQQLVSEDVDRFTKETCIAPAVDFSVPANPQVKVNIIYRHQAERKSRSTTEYILPAGKFQNVIDNVSVQAGDARYNCGVQAGPSGPQPSIVGPIVSRGTLAATDYSYQGFGPCPTQPAAVFIFGDIGTPKQTLYRALTERSTDAVYSDQRGRVFRDQVLPGGQFIADASPIGEVFLATPDMSVIVHEPKPGNMPVLTRESVPSEVVRLLAAIWM